MSSPSRQWPLWAEFTPHDASEASDIDFIKAKRSIIAEYGPEALRKSWIRTCHNLRSVTEEIAARGSSMCPNSFRQDLVPQQYRAQDIGIWRTGENIGEEYVKTHD